jgi:hypothetical protein
MSPLFKRLLWGRSNLEPFQTNIRVVFEESLDDVVKVLVPDPHFMAAALHGGILPPIESFLRDKEKLDSWLLRFQNKVNSLFSWRLVGGAEHPYADPIEAMSEEQAIEYLIQKDLPNHVWEDHQRSNRKKFIICRAEQLPTSRNYREAWSIKHES